MSRDAKRKTVISITSVLKLKKNQCEVPPAAYPYNPYEAEESTPPWSDTVGCVDKPLPFTALIFIFSFRLYFLT